MSWPAAVVVLVLASIFADIGLTSSFQLTIEPRHARVRPRDNVTVMCRADVKFSDCQFTWWDVDDTKEGPHFEFGDGRDSDFSYLTNSTSEMDWRLAGYRYEGQGLDHGQCGIQLYGVVLRYRMLGCRVRTIGGGWIYASMTICAEAKDPIELDFTPMQPVVLPGQNLAFLCRTSSPLASCKFRFPGIDVIPFINVDVRQSARRNNSHSSRPSTPDRSAAHWSFYGSSLREGQCGVKLENVTHHQDGWVYFDAETVSGGYDRRVLYLTVASPPTELTMKVSHHQLTEHQSYTATCRVSESRPAANITWYLDEVLLRHDALDDSTAHNNAESPWRWNHDLHSVSQTMTLQAKRQDNGKTLRCIAEHVALLQPLVAVTPISVGDGALVQPGVAVTPIRVGDVALTQSLGGTPPAIVSCPALTSSAGVSLQCKLEGRLVNCASWPMVAGTVATMNTLCSPEYLEPRYAQYRTITCLASGSWNKPVLACKRPPPVTLPTISTTKATPPAIVKCPALTSSAGVSLQCKLGRRTINCAGPMVAGTVATMNPACSGEYLVPRNAQYRSITCLASGSWDKPVLACNRGTPSAIVDCPTLNSSAEVSLQCKLAGQTVNCAWPMEAGTVATMNPACSGEYLVPKNAQYRTITCLASGSWDKPVLTCKPGPPAAIVPCPALPRSSKVTLRCELAGRTVNCSTPIQAGTVATMTPECSGESLLPGYAQYRTITCLASGSWDKQALACNQGCGVSLGAGEQPLTVRAGPVAPGEFPWHVGVYKLYNGEYEQVCTGSILSPKIILTAASCFWKTRRDDQVNVSLFKVAAGKLKRDWNSTDVHVQRRDVASVEAPERYIGIVTLHSYNVAVVKLTEALLLTDYVNVVCLDRDPSVHRQEQYLTGKSGQVAGWAFAEEDSPGPALRAVTLAYLDHVECHNVLGPDLRRLQTVDHFCAGSTDDYRGYTVCESDQGAGLVVFNEKRHRYFLHGIASVAFKPSTNREICYPSPLVNFGKIAQFVEWIVSTMS